MKRNRKCKEGFANEEPAGEKRPDVSGRKENGSTAKEEKKTESPPGVCAASFFAPDPWRPPVYGRCSNAYTERTGEGIDALRPPMDVELLTVNPYSRPGTATEKIRGIVVHYTANPGATAMDNRNYFENLKDTHETKVSSNFVIGMEGEIVQCVPTWEVAYASNSRNQDTVSIECCHPDESGAFTDATYASLVDLCAWLCLKFDLTEEDVIRHYDVTGKECPRYFVEHTDAWENFRADVKEALAKDFNY